MATEQLDHILENGEIDNARWFEWYLPYDNYHLIQDAISKYNISVNPENFIVNSDAELVSINIPPPNLEDNSNQQPEAYSAISMGQLYVGDNGLKIEGFSDVAIFNVTGEEGSTLAGEVSFGKGFGELFIFSKSGFIIDNLKLNNVKLWLIAGSLEDYFPEYKKGLTKEQLYKQKFDTKLSSFSVLSGGILASNSKIDFFASLGSCEGKLKSKIVSLSFNKDNLKDSASYNPFQQKGCAIEAEVVEFNSLTKDINLELSSNITGEKLIKIQAQGVAQNKGNISSYGIFEVEANNWENLGYVNAKKYIFRLDNFSLVYLKLYNDLVLEYRGTEDLNLPVITGVSKVVFAASNSNIILSGFSNIDYVEVNSSKKVIFAENFVIDHVNELVIDSKQIDEIKARIEVQKRLALSVADDQVLVVSANLKSNENILLKGYQVVLKENVVEAANIISLIVSDKGEGGVYALNYNLLKAKFLQVNSPSGERVKYLDLASSRIEVASDAFLKVENIILHPNKLVTNSYEIAYNCYGKSLDNKCEHYYRIMYYEEICSGSSFIINGNLFLETNSVTVDCSQFRVEGSIYLPNDKRELEVTVKSHELKRFISSDINCPTSVSIQTRNCLLESYGVLINYSNERVNVEPIKKNINYPPSCSTSSFSANKVIGQYKRFQVGCFNSKVSNEINLGAKINQMLSSGHYEAKSLASVLQLNQGDYKQLISLDPGRKVERQEKMLFPNMYGSELDFIKAYHLEQNLYEYRSVSEFIFYLFFKFSTMNHLLKTSFENDFICDYDIKYFFDKLGLGLRQGFDIICDSNCQLELIKNALEKATGFKDLKSIVKRIPNILHAETKEFSDPKEAFCYDIKLMLNNGISFLKDCYTLEYNESTGLITCKQQEDLWEFKEKKRKKAEYDRYEKEYLQKVSKYYANINPFDYGKVLTPCPIIFDPPPFKPGNPENDPIEWPPKLNPTIGLPFPLDKVKAPMIWPVYVTFQGKKVLFPVVYLPEEVLLNSPGRMTGAFLDAQEWKVSGDDAIIAAGLFGASGVFGAKNLAVFGHIIKQNDATQKEKKPFIVEAENMMIASLTSTQYIASGQTATIKHTDASIATQDGGEIYLLIHENLYIRAATLSGKVYANVGKDVIIVPAIDFSSYEHYQSNGYKKWVKVKHFLPKFEGEIYIESKGDQYVVGAEVKGKSIFNLISTHGKITINPAKDIEKNEESYWTTKKKRFLGIPYATKTSSTFSSYSQQTISGNIMGDPNEPLQSLTITTYGNLAIYALQAYTKHLYLEAGKGNPIPQDLIISAGDIERHSQTIYKENKSGLMFTNGGIVFSEKYKSSDTSIEIEQVPTRIVVFGNLEDTPAYLISNGRYIQLGSTISNKDGKLEIRAPKGAYIGSLPNIKVHIVEVEESSLGISLKVTKEEAAAQIGINIRSFSHEQYSEEPVLSELDAKDLKILISNGNLKTKGAILSYTNALIKALEHVDEPAVRKYFETIKLKEGGLNLKLGIRTNLFGAINSFKKAKDSQVNSPESFLNAASAYYGAVSDWIKLVALPIQGGLFIEGGFKSEKLTISQVIPVPSRFEGMGDLIHKVDKLKMTGTKVTGINWYIDAKEVLYANAFSSFEQKSDSKSANIIIPIVGGISSLFQVSPINKYKSHIEDYHQMEVILSGDLVMKVAGPVSIEGSYVEADKILIDAKSMVIKSAQRVIEQRGKGFSFGLGDVSKISNFFESVGGYVERRDARWVNELTQLIGREKVEIILSESLNIVGSIIANAERNVDGTLTDKGKMQIKAAEIFVENIHSYDEGLILGASFKLASADGMFGNSYGIKFGYSNKEQTAKGTAGEGDIEGDIHGDLNRDINNAKSDIDEEEIETIDVEFHTMNGEEIRKRLERPLHQRLYEDSGIKETVEFLAEQFSFLGRLFSANEPEKTPEQEIEEMFREEELREEFLKKYLEEQEESDEISEEELEKIIKEAEEFMAYLQGLNEESEPEEDHETIDLDKEENKATEKNKKGKEKSEGKSTEKVKEEPAQQEVKEDHKADNKKEEKVDQKPKKKPTVKLLDELGEFIIDLEKNHPKVIGIPKAIIGAKNDLTSDAFRIVGRGVGRIFAGEDGADAVDKGLEDLGVFMSKKIDEASTEGERKALGYLYFFLGGKDLFKKLKPTKPKTWAKEEFKGGKKVYNVDPGIYKQFSGIKKEIVDKNIVKAKKYVDKVSKENLASIENKLGGMTELQKLSVTKALEAQALEKGAFTAGKNHPTHEFRDSHIYASKHGGHADDYIKMSSSAYRVHNTLKVETHWVENIKTGERFDFKPVERVIKSGAKQ